MGHLKGFLQLTPKNTIKRNVLLQVVIGKKSLPCTKGEHSGFVLETPFSRSLCEAVNWQNVASFLDAHLMVNNQGCLNYLKYHTILNIKYSCHMQNWGKLLCKQKNKNLV